MKRIALLILAVFLLTGCGPTTQGRNYDVKFDVTNNDGIMFFNPGVEALSTSGDSTTSPTNTMDLKDLLNMDPEDLINTLSAMGVGSDAIKEVLDKINKKRAEEDMVKPDPEPTPPPSPVPTPTPEPVEPEPTPDEVVKTAYSVFHTVADNRGVWNFDPNLVMPKKFILNAGNCVVNKQFVLGSDGRSNPMIGYQGWLVKPSEVPGRGYGVLGKVGECLTTETISITYNAQ